MVRSVIPVSSVSCGVPVTFTASLKFTWIEIEDVALYDRSELEELTEETVGAVESLDEDVRKSHEDAVEPA